MRGVPGRLPHWLHAHTERTDLGLPSFLAVMLLWYQHWFLAFLLLNHTWGRRPICNLHNILWGRLVLNWEPWVQGILAWVKRELPHFIQKHMPLLMFWGTQSTILCLMFMIRWQAVLRRVFWRRIGSSVKSLLLEHASFLCRNCIFSWTFELANCLSICSDSNLFLPIESLNLGPHRYEELVLFLNLSECWVESCRR